MSGIYLDRVRIDLRVSYALAAELIQGDLKSSYAAECAQVGEYVPTVSDPFRFFQLTLVAIDPTLVDRKSVASRQVSYDLDHALDVPLSLFGKSHELTPLNDVQLCGFFPQSHADIVYHYDVYKKGR